MRRIQVKFAKVLFTAWLVVICTTANAQKLPGVQQVSLYAPDTVKIDGTANEWGHNLMAYNKALEVFYTIANDDANIYLVIHAKYHDIIDKILRGGISFTLNHTIKKKDDMAITVTYPVIRDAAVSDLTNMLARKGKDSREAKGQAVPIDDLNKLMQLRSKLIDVKGINSIADESLSVYNQENIKAVSRFDSSVAYTYELAIPIKYLNLPNNGAYAFSYHIKINEPAEIQAQVQVQHGNGMAPAPPPPPMLTSNLSPTDFWGEYTLAKK